MPTKKRARGKSDEKKQLADAKRALKEAKEVLTMELKKLEKQYDAMCHHVPFKF